VVEKLILLPASEAQSLWMRVEFLLKTESGYLRDAEVTLFTLANPETSNQKGGKMRAGWLCEFAGKKKRQQRKVGRKRSSSNRPARN